jgi:hypothetical protein
MKAIQVLIQECPEELRRQLDMKVCNRCFRILKQQDLERLIKDKDDYYLVHLVEYHWREISSLLDDGVVKYFGGKHEGREVNTFEKLYKKLEPLSFRDALKPKDYTKPITLFTSPLLAIFSNCKRLKI